MQANAEFGKTPENYYAVTRGDKCVVICNEVPRDWKDVVAEAKELFDEVEDEVLESEEFQETVRDYMDEWDRSGYDEEQIIFFAIQKAIPLEIEHIAEILTYAEEGSKYHSLEFEFVSGDDVMDAICENEQDGGRALYMAYCNQMR